MKKKILLVLLIAAVLLPAFIFAGGQQDASEGKSDLPKKSVM